MDDLVVAFPLSLNCALSRSSLYTTAVVKSITLYEGRKADLNKLLDYKGHLEILLKNF